MICYIEVCYLGVYLSIRLIHKAIRLKYVMFSDVGHGFRKKENEIEGYGKILTFLNKYLKGENR